MNSELLTLSPSLPRSFSLASAAMIILITHSTNEKNKKKNGRSLGIGLASSLLLLYTKRQRKGNEGIRQEEKKKSPHQYAQNPRADAFMSLFSILSLSLSLSSTQLYNDDDKQQQQQQ
jgi:hypothetical protein